MWMRRRLALLSLLVLYPKTSIANVFDPGLEDPSPFEPFERDYFHEINDQEFEDNIDNERVNALFHYNILSHGGNRTSTKRELSANSATIGNFTQLSCNDPTSPSWSSCGALVSSIIPSSDSEMLVIPCGVCYTFDIEGDVLLPGGIDIKGKLVFPLNHKASIYTSSVIVEGALEINVDHPKVSPENLATHFILTGTEDVMFSPSDTPNENACMNQPNGICNLGPKPFVIAGGKVTINSMPETCATHTTLLKKVHKDPVYDPQDFPEFQPLPPTCPESGISYISYDFEDGYGNWTGEDGAFMVKDDGVLKITNRRLTDRGPKLDLTPMFPSSCLFPNQEYLFVSR